MAQSGAGQNFSTVCPDFNPPNNTDFLPLSLMKVEPCQEMPQTQPADQMMLEKYTPIPPGEEENCEIEKDFKDIFIHTEQMICIGKKEVRHSIAIISELILLLKHEKELLNQILKRMVKFRDMMMKNKKKATEWEKAYFEKHACIQCYICQITYFRGCSPRTTEDILNQVKQKIIFQILSKTVNTANRVMVQISMEETITNEIELTFGDITPNIKVLLKQIDCWLKVLKSHLYHQQLILVKWEKVPNMIKNIMEKDEERTNTIDDPLIAGFMNKLKPYEDRLKRIEDLICQMCGPSYGTCNTETNKKGDKSGEPYSRSRTRGPGTRVDTRSASHGRGTDKRSPSRRPGTRVDTRTASHGPGSDKRSARGPGTRATPRSPTGGQGDQGASWYPGSPMGGPCFSVDPCLAAGSQINPWVQGPSTGVQWNPWETTTVQKRESTPTQHRGPFICPPRGCNPCKHIDDPRNPEGSGQPPGGPNGLITIYPPPSGPSYPIYPSPSIGGFNYSFNPCPPIDVSSYPVNPCPPVGGSGYQYYPCPPTGGTNYPFMGNT